MVLVRKIQQMEKPCLNSILIQMLSRSGLRRRVKTTTVRSQSAGRTLGSSWTEPPRRTRTTPARQFQSPGQVLSETCLYRPRRVRLDKKQAFIFSILVFSVGEPDARAWLEQHVVTPYWVAHAPRFPHSLHLHSNLLNVW